MPRLLSKEHSEDFILYTAQDLALLRLAQAEFIKQYQGIDIEQFEQQELDLGEFFTALGTINFFAEKRIITLRIDDIAKINDQDFSELCSAIETAEGCRVVVFLFFGDKYSSEGKQAKSLKKLFLTIGVNKHLEPLKGEGIKKFIRSTTESLGCEIEPQAIDLLITKFDRDIILLEKEIEKVAAYSDYSKITVEDVEAISTTVLSADIFSLVNLLVSGNSRECFSRLSILLEQGNEPIAILAAITGSFFDMYSVGVGYAAGKKHGEVFKELGYKGNDYRLKKALEVSSRLKRGKLSKILRLLLEADIKLKSTSAERDTTLYRYLIGVSNIIEAR